MTLWRCIAGGICIFFLVQGLLVVAFSKARRRNPFLKHNL